MNSKLEEQAQQYDLDSNIGFLVSDAHRLVTAVVDKVMSPLGLTRSQLRVVLYLLRKDGCTQVELAEKLGIGKVAMGGLLDRLEEKKLVQRKSNEQDRRAKRVFLTKEVEKLYDPIFEMGGDVMNMLLKGLNKKERQQFSDFLLLLKENCKEVLQDEEL
jgi:DNA-binding MarR family transcriptional regulator